MPASQFRLNQKGAIFFGILMGILILGVVIGVYFIAQNTGFLPKAWDSRPSEPRSGLIKIASDSGAPPPPQKPGTKPSATTSAQPKTATSSAKPASPSASLKPATGSGGVANPPRLVD